MKMRVEDVPLAIAAEFGVRDEPGWEGAFTRHDAPGAPLSGGTRVKKIAADPSGDLTPIGSVGTVLGSIGPMPEAGRRALLQRAGIDGRYLYFIEWDGRPKVAVACGDWKIGTVP